VLGRELWEKVNAGQLKPDDAILRSEEESTETVIELKRIPGHVLIETDVLYGKLKDDFKVFRRVGPADDSGMLRRAPKLYQLPSGDWVDPKTVKSVVAADEEQTGSIQVLPRPIVWHGYGMISIREYATFELACLARDKVAQEVNEACTPVRKRTNRNLETSAEDDDDEHDDDVYDDRQGSTNLRDY